MVECKYLYRLCKFLCKDESDVNSNDVKQRLYTDSSSAMALVQRAGTGRFKHVQIKQFFLQNPLKVGIFTIHKINAQLNPGDLNAKRLSSERRKFLGRLIGLFMANLDEENDDHELRRVRRRANRYLHERFRVTGQRGDMMVDIESIYADLNEYLGGGRVRVDQPREPVDIPMADAEPEGEDEEQEDGDDPPEEGSDDNGDDMVAKALNCQVLNAQTIDRDDRHDDSDEDMGAETAEERRLRYRNSSQEEVSDPDEWAKLHYGHMDFDDCERMVAYSRANRFRLNRAAATLRGRHSNAAAAGSWEETANYLRALYEVEQVMDIARIRDRFHLFCAHLARKKFQTGTACLCAALPLVGSASSTMSEAYCNKSGNAVLVKDDIGKAKPSIYDLPPEVDLVAQCNKTVLILLETLRNLTTQIQTLRTIIAKGSWLFLEHFREYNQWPWRSFNPLEQQLAHHPSFVFAEVLFFLLSGFAFLHAACESYAKEERRLMLKPGWKAGVILFSTVNDYIFMLLPVVDNFWQAQGLIMLTPRMPLYIPCVYNGFMYWSTAGFLVQDHFVLLVSAVGFGSAFKMFQKQLENTQEFFEVEIMIPEAWTITFTACFSLLLRLGADLRWSQVKTLALACWSTPLMLIVLNVFTVLGLDRIGMPGPQTVLAATLCFSAMCICQPKPEAWPQKKAQLLNCPEHWSVRAMLCTYFATLVLVGLLFSPEKQVSTGVHQQFGSCNATDIDLMGYERKRYICRERFPMTYFHFDCRMPEASAEPFVALILPRPKRDDDVYTYWV
eukprot:s3633_g6.t1